jgi:hypothetical protein
VRITASAQGVLCTLASARLVVTHAEKLGIDCRPTISRDPINHLGAVLADSILQAGLNYRTVVKVRVDRIESLFPDAATLSGVLDVIGRGGISDFLLWRHPTKVARFISLAEVLRKHGVEDVRLLQRCLLDLEFHDRLLAVNGIGFKTIDYLCCLVGLDCVAVDRHIRAFANDAGVEVTDYYGLKTIISYAADLLGISRRDFDAWIWGRVSQRRSAPLQYELI